MLQSYLFLYSVCHAKERAETELNTAAHSRDRQQLSVCPYGTAIVTSYYWVSGKGMTQKLREPLNIFNPASSQKIAQCSEKAFEW